jgi:hypothetical protein
MSCTIGWHARTALRFFGAVRRDAGGIARKIYRVFRSKRIGVMWHADC